METRGKLDSFSIIHALAYSFIGFQTMFIATNWNPIYWNTACLVVNSGSLEEEEEKEEIVSIYEVEDQDNYTYEDLPDRSGKKKKEKTTDYGKIAKAIGDIMGRGIKISLVDINKSNYGFEPDPVNNEILFGIKALNGIGGPIIEQISANRPYINLKDFMQRCPLNKTAMISLIKAGAFDNLEKDIANELNVEPRKFIMAYYLSQVSDKKKRLTLQNFNGLIEHELVPQELELQKNTFRFNKYLKTRKYKNYYVFDSSAENFYNKFFDVNSLVVIEGNTCIEQTVWDKIYKKTMDIARDWLNETQEETLNKYNNLLFKEVWDKYASGNISAWEMEALCFYYHEHELAKANRTKYGLVNFNSLSADATVDYFFKRDGKEIPIYKIFRIAGTVIGKNDTKSSITLLTPDGIVPVKFSKEYFALANRQISEHQEDGTKKVLEKSWFTRGTKLLVQGFRRDDTFNAKTYSKTIGHQLYKIESIDESSGELVLTHTRKGEVEENVEI